jgi:hypothetical protein
MIVNEKFLDTAMKRNILIFDWEDKLNIVTSRLLNLMSRMAYLSYGQKLTKFFVPVGADLEYDYDFRIHFIDVNFWIKTKSHLEKAGLSLSPNRPYLIIGYNNKDFCILGCY